MAGITKRLALAIALFLLAVAGTAGLELPAQAQEKKSTELKMPRKPLPEHALVTMDFQDVDLTVVIKFMGELTGKNFLVSDQVRGKVTIISPRKITVGEAYKVFESVLEMNGYTAIPGEDMIKIVPSGLARQSGLQTYEGKQPEEADPAARMITQIVPLEFAFAEEVRHLFTPLISKDGMIVAHKATNHLVITDRAANVQRLLKIIDQIDIPLREERITVLSLEHASAKVLADKLTQLVSPDLRRITPGAPGVPGAPVQRIVKVIPDERTNSLVILANERDAREMRQLVAQLDRQAPPGRSQLHVRYLKHARAEELAKVLSTIVTARTRILQRTQPPAAAPGQPGAAPEDTSITADKATNSLVITASPQEFRDLEEVIQKLDTVRSQVLVEALIAEVSMDRALQLGVEWRLMDQPVEGSVRGFGGTNYGLISGVQSGNPASGLLLGLAKGFLTINGVQVPNLGALVQAFQKDTDTNVLSTPQLLTMDNEKAKIIVATNVPVLKTDLSTPLASATPTVTSVALSRTFEYKDVGIQMEITPHISTGSMVRLEVATEVSNILSQDPNIPGFITTRKRQANTTVAVESGQMVVIGGLLEDNRNETTNKVPCVGNVPLLGWLFKTYSGTKSKTNLMVFITPHILRNSEDMEKATAREKQKAEENLKQLQKERQREVPETLEKLVK